jgi:CelD/BcsL family acetyltransferase involved in cellulose biosynthesis
MRTPAEVDLQKRPLRVERLSDTDFDAMEEAWNALVDASDSGSVFTTWDYLHTWWQHFGTKNRELLLLGAFDQERLVGLAPLYTTRTAGSFTEIRFLGSGDVVSPDYLDLLVDRSGDVAGIRRALLEHATRVTEWNRIHLTDIVDDRAADAAFRSLRPSVAYVKDRGAVCSYLTLPASWEAFLATLSSRFRHNLKRSIRILTVDEGAAFDVAGTPDAVDRAFHDLRALHSARWAAVGRPSRYQNATYFAFHTDVSKRLLAKDQLRLYRLTLGEESLAILYCYRYRSKIYYYSGSFSSTGPLSRHSPGNVVRALAIRSAIAEQCVEFDFLRGDNDYKAHWCNGQRSSYTYFIVPAGMRGHWANRDVYVRFAKRRLRSATARAQQLQASWMGKSAAAAESK